MEQKRAIIAVLIILVLGAAIAGMVLFTGTRTPTDTTGDTYRRQFPTIIDDQLIPDPRMRSWIFGDLPEMLSGSRQVKDGAETMTIAFKTTTRSVSLLPQYREYMIRTGWTVSGSSDDPRSTFIAGIRRYQLLKDNTTVTAAMTKEDGFTVVRVTVAGPEPVKAEE